MALDQDAVDDAEREWMKAHGVASDAANKASEAWQRYNRMAQGKPVDLRPAPQLKPLRAGVSGVRLPLAAMRMK
jgi:hypothetical protein